MDTGENSQIIVPAMECDDHIEEHPESYGKYASQASYIYSLNKEKSMNLICPDYANVNYKVKLMGTR